MSDAPRHQPTSRREPLLASLLSFVWPGLGQIYLGHTRWAAFFGLPVAAGVILGIVLLRQVDPLVLLFDASALTALAIANLLLLAWRCAGILHLLSLRRRNTATRLLASAVLCALTVVMHAIPASLLSDTITTLNAIARPANQSTSVIALPDRPLDSPPVRESEMTVSRVPPAPLDTMNILLVGVDAGPGRATRLTDSMLLVSIEPSTRRAAIVSVPRDLYGVPLPDGSLYEAKLNSLMTYADQRADRFPAGGPEVLKQMVGAMLGCEIHYFAAFDLVGFQRVIDAIGGVDVAVQRPIRDPFFDFYLEPGTHHFNGVSALLFVRSRMGSGDSDFTRADRQQQLLIALYEKLSPAEALAEYSGLMRVVRETVFTDIPLDDLPTVVSVLRSVDIRRADRLVLQPPDYAVAATGPGGAYVLIPNLAAIRAAGDELVP